MPKEDGMRDAKETPAAAPAPKFRASCGRGALLDAISTVLPAVAKPTTIPVLSGVGIAAAGPGGLSVRGTNLDIEIATALDAVGARGETCVPAAALRHILATMVGAEVEIASETDGRLRIACGADVARLTPFNPGDLPERLAAGRDDETCVADIRLGAGALARALSGPRRCVSREETRYYLNGVCLEAEGTTLRTIATDGHRLLARETTLLRDVGDARRTTIVPAAALAPAIRLADRAETRLRLFETTVMRPVHERDADGKLVYGERGPIKIGEVPEAFIRRVAVDFGNGATTLTARCIDGTYPDWRLVLPAEDAITQTLSFAAGDLARAARLAPGDNDRALTLAHDGNGAVVVSRRDPDFGDTESRLEVAVGVAGAPIRFGLNRRYLLDMLRVMGGARVSVALIDDRSAMRISAEAGAPGAGDVAILMPMRV